MAVHEHVGVYGAWLQDGALVTVEKRRGPYKGWLDLPGGAPEPGEGVIDTLRRELREECGVVLTAVLGRADLDVRLDRTSDGSVIDFHHRGRIALVEVGGPVAQVEAVEDVARVVLLQRHASRPVTPAVDIGWRLVDGAQ